MSKKLVTADLFSIYSKLVLLETGHMKITEAIVKNGFVIIKGVAKKGWTGQFEQKVVPDKYCPPITIHGQASYFATSDDNGKIQDFAITSNGNLYLWIPTALKIDEVIQVMYPLNI